MNETRGGKPAGHFLALWYKEITPCGEFRDRWYNLCVKGGNAMRRHTSTGSGSLSLRAAGYSVAGRLLQHNEDAFALYDLSDVKQAELNGRLYLVADGIGTHHAAKTASHIAIETIPAVYYSQPEGGAPLRRLQQAFSAAHTRICEEAEAHPEYGEMATTCTAVVVKGARVWIAHIGDSRAYLIRRATSRFHPAIARLTTDHSLAATMVRAGELNSEQMRNLAHRDIFLKALGRSYENNPYPDFAIHQMRAGDVLMLCSDGLWGALSEEEIAEMCSRLSPQQASEELVRLANQEGGDENISVILLAFSE
jgi:serine/threonine protein phosphatase PrpC